MLRATGRQGGPRKAEPSILRHPALKWRYTANVMLRFEWDPVKARTYQRKHGISFEDAMHVFDDPHALFELDRADEFGELRWHAIGLIGDVAVVLVAHTIREEGDDEIVRMISARRATRQ